jgi:hypothetical protein
MGHHGCSPEGIVQIVAGPFCVPIPESLAFPVKKSYNTPETKERETARNEGE